MKEDTRSFYELVVRRTVERIIRGLDEALDLAELARGAALSPLHFHRVFRGMVGETPLELHRRLRLERAAFRLATGQASVTSLAFEAGYETHESFTRAFREAYAASPSEFRTRTHGADGGCSPSLPYRLAARSAVHFVEPPTAALELSLARGGSVMNVEIQTMPEQRVAAITHLGPYNTISEAFERLGQIAGPRGLVGEHTAMVAVYHDDPETTPASELRSEAGLVVPSASTIPDELKELRLPAGRYARFTHVGPYTKLGDAWAAFMGEWLPNSGQRVGNGVCYEVYRNTPMTAEPDELRTDLYLALAD